MRTSPRLELVLVPSDPEAAPIAPARALLEAWISRGVLMPDGGAGPRAAELLPEGFSRVRLDLPDGVGFYANRQGGFRVACPEGGANLVAAFVHATGAWRAGGPRTLSCPACGHTHPLEALDFRPPAAFGRLAIVIADVGSATLPVAARAEVERALGPFATIGRRG